MMMCWGTGLLRRRSRSGIVMKKPGLANEPGLLLRSRWLLQRSRGLLANVSGVVTEKPGLAIELGAGSWGFLLYRLAGD